ncbi:hypothetical protein H4B96_27100, partial [Pseudomonas juntendi]|nr:hypothetical protein [Pseudomonas juntendi]MBA6151084.1 hypothetical protein [Pseudomonas juntendi]
MPRLHDKLIGASLSLFDEIFQQMTEFKIDLIESWLDDQPLAGGAGEKIVEMRAI